MDDGRELVFKLCFGDKVFEFVDILLEPIVRSSVFVFAQFLEESGYVAVHFHFGVKGVKVLVVVHNKFLKSLFSALMQVLAILSYHFSKKATPFPVPILLRMRVILISSKE